MLRSVLEGVAMNLNIILEILQNAVEIKEMLVVGGLAQGEENRKILADIYGMNVVRLEHLEEATSIGAAVIAGVGCGALEGFESVELFNKRCESNAPVAENIESYKAYKELFEEAYQSQLSLYGKLAKL